VTDATGLCFLSYRRSRSSDAGAIIGALRDRGIPTWQDVSDLASALTEQDLRHVLHDDATAGAVLYVTPDVEQSDVIRNIEAPIILERHHRDDRFVAVVVAAGGLDYGEIDRVLGPRVGPTYMPAWNILKIHSNPITHTDTAGVADRMLELRAAAVNEQLSPGDPLKIIVSTRTPIMKTTGWAFAADLTHRFDGRLAKPGAWETNILPGFRSIRTAIQKKSRGRSVECSGQISLVAAAALGAEFLSVSGLHATWIQDLNTFGGGQEAWSLHAKRQPTDFKADIYPARVEKEDVALILSVTHDIMDDVRSAFRDNFPFRTLVHVHRPGAVTRGAQISAGEALTVAHLAVDGVREACTVQKTRGAVHLLLAAPAGLAFLIGQLLNAFGEVRTYEHMPGSDPCYVRAATLRPSQ